LALALGLFGSGISLCRALPTVLQL
jgi:hypothetical protein